MVEGIVCACAVVRFFTQNTLGNGEKTWFGLKRPFGCY